MRSIETQIAMTVLYESTFGIFDHFGDARKGIKRRPLSSVAYHPSESINEGGVLENVIRNYSQRAIKDVFGLNLKEFLDLPRDITEMLMRIADEHRATAQHTLANIEKEMNK